jgi:hypothetical protein
LVAQRLSGFAPGLCCPASAGRGWRSSRAQTRPEEAANSQALSTRQSIAVSALALATQSQQSVLQLLR